jgi:hypothetical protein
MNAELGRWLHAKRDRTHTSQWIITHSWKHLAIELFLIDYNPLFGCINTTDFRLLNEII